MSLASALLDVESVQSLLTLGFDINFKTDEDRTPLIFAVGNAITDPDKGKAVVELLLKNGADQTIVGGGQTIVGGGQTIVGGGQTIVGGGQTAADRISAIKDQTLKGALQALLVQYPPKAPADTASSSSAQPVPSSSSSSSSSAAPISASSIDPSAINQPNQFGRTPLMQAIVDKKPIQEIEALLNMPGININQAVSRSDGHASNGMTALLWAADNGQTEVVNLLLQNYKTNIIHQKSGGSTAMILAARNGHIDTLKLLLRTLETRAQLNAIMDSNTKGESVLSCLLLQLDKGKLNLDPKIKPRNGQKNDHNFIVDLLRQLNLYDPSFEQTDICKRWREKLNAASKAAYPLFG